MDNIGGLIVAAGDCGAREEITPLMKLGSVSVIRRIVITLQLADIQPIVVVTGYHALEVEQHLAGYNVIFIRNEDYENTDKLYSTKLGLEYLQDKCDRVVFTPVTIPLYTAETVKRLIAANRKIVVPVHRGKRGHPVLLGTEVIRHILAYNGNGGLNDALRQLEAVYEYVEVQDKGTVLNAEKIDKWDDVLDINHLTDIHPFLQIHLQKENTIFDSRARLLLTLIDEVHSVKGACKYMALSTGKAWVIINELEEALGYPVVARRQGGKAGGKTSLTDKGRIFLDKYRVYEESVRKEAYDKFIEIFDEYR